jgi:cytochrome c-type biogenesis protein CcmE
MLTRMSRKSFMQASEEYSTQARPYKIGRINLGMTGNAVRVSGTVRKISFKWLNRPHFQVEDETANIRVIMFTSPMEEIKTDDKVEVLGMVMKNLFARKTPAISAVSIKKID